MIYIYLLYVMISATILVFISNKSKREWLFKVVVITFLPIIGWLLPIIWPKKAIRNKGESLEDYLKQQNEDIEIELMATKEIVEKEKELNIIPIEEALVVSDYTTRRNVMLDVLKKDAIQYMDVIKMAILNDDTETSHFAVSAVIEVKRKLLLALQTFSVEFEKNPKDIAIASSYAQVLKEYMSSGFLDQQTVKKYKYAYIQVLGQLVKNSSKEASTFEEKMKVEIELQEFAAAEKTGLQYLEEFSNLEDPYICMMNYYFSMHSKKKMQQVIDELMNSSVQFSNRALTIVRYWTGGNDYVFKG